MNGQLEIVTGGWVMTDEADSNYYSTIMELIEGHEFLINQLGVAPQNHWSIDPFGLSATIPYVLNRANFSNMVIQRVHYSVKKYLAKNRSLEFKWRQLFSSSNITDITTHILPFFIYDVPHTCGPDPKICCQYDFRRLISPTCPWGIPPISINERNVAERAETLADQYRKKAQLFFTNTLLVPLGDDFRYDIESEWVDQYSNYKLLMDYINNKKELNMKVKFGTLNDYFTAMKKNLEEMKPKSLPILSGDFFTYADRVDHYWSGYFTSRPFYKRMDRILQHYLRTADILFSFALSKSKNSAQKIDVGLYNNLVEARRALSLFQHHDAVAGTARSFVMRDYGRKMLDAVNNCKKLISNATYFLIKLPNTAAGLMEVNEEHFYNSLPMKKIIPDKSVIVLFNSLENKRNEVVCIHVNSPKIRIMLDSDQHQPLLQQIGPILSVNPINGNIIAEKDKFELCFLAEVPAFGFARYKIFESDDLSHKVKLQSPDIISIPDFNVKIINIEEQSVSLYNNHVKCHFNTKTGFLENIVKSNNNKLTTRMSFVRYTTRPYMAKPGDSKSGAYLFLPDGPAIPIFPTNNTYVHVVGAVRQYIFLRGDREFGLEQVISLDIDDNALSIANTIDLNAENASFSDVEIAMRINADNENEEEQFYTDLNNFQMIRRQRLKKLPIQAHFYPMSAAAFIENSKFRLTLIGRQALGVANLETGQIDVMLDRRLFNDDDRGLGEGIMDNRKTISQFRLLIENPITYTNNQQSKSNDHSTIGYLSLQAHLAQLTQHYPLFVLYGKFNIDEQLGTPSVFSIINNNPFSCDIHVVALRALSKPTIYSYKQEDVDTSVLRNTLPDDSLALILHRFGFNCAQEDQNNLNSLCTSSRKKFGEVDLTHMMDDLNLKSINNASLTLLYKSTQPLTNLIQEMSVMELRTLKLNF